MNTASLTAKTDSQLAKELYYKIHYPNFGVYIHNKYSWAHLILNRTILSTLQHNTKKQGAAITNI